MSDLTNLSEDACALLMEVLEKEQRYLSEGGSIQTGGRPVDKSRRQEIIGHLLWQLRTADLKPHLSERIVDGSLSRG